MTDRGRYFILNAQFITHELAMSALLKKGETLRCPMCGKPQEGPVEDYVVPGCIGEASECEDDCESCGAGFTVICVAKDQYEVLAV